MVFGAHYERLLALADSFSERGVGGPFICESRADVLDDRRCDTLRKMGVIAVKVGVESSDAQHLSTMNKQLGRGGLERGLASLRRHDLKLILYLMLGGPDSSKRRPGRRSNGHQRSSPTTSSCQHGPMMRWAEAIASNTTRISVPTAASLEHR